MPKLSEDQLTSIAQQFHDLSVSISQFRLDRIHEGTSLSDPGIVQLLGLQWSLLNTSSSFYIQAAQVTLADAETAVTQITAATNDANTAIKKLQVIDRVVSIGSAAGALAAAIMTGDMDQIAAGAKGVYTAVKG